MTWGQLRFQLQTGAPGVPADLLDEFLNTTYEAVLEATDWQGLKYHCAVQTLAAYQSATDTVTLTSGATTAIITVTYVYSSSSGGGTLTPSSSSVGLSALPGSSTSAQITLTNNTQNAISFPAP